MSKIKKVLCVWLDDTTDSDNQKWIVSRDELAEDGKTDHTQTLSVCDEYDDAVAIAKTKAHELELSVYKTENVLHPETELIYGLYHAECENGDFGLTTFFAADFEAAKELATEWTEEGEWKEDDEVTVEIKGPDGDDSFIVAVKSTIRKIEFFTHENGMAVWAGTGRVLKNKDIVDCPLDFGTDDHEDIYEAISEKIAEGETEGDFSNAYEVKYSWEVK